MCDNLDIRTPGFFFMESQHGYLYTPITRTVYRFAQKGSKIEVTAECSVVHKMKLERDGYNYLETFHIIMLYSFVLFF